MLSTLGWSLSALRGQLDLPARASAEAVAAVSGGRVRRARPRMAALAVRALPWILPWDAEQYIGAHFSKLGAQTEAMLTGWVEAGAAQGTSVESLRELHGRVRAEGVAPRAS